MNIHDKIFHKALNLELLLASELIRIYKFADTGELMFVANKLKQIRVSEDKVSWQIDRNVNITNVCISGCKFCNFHCKPHETQKSHTTTLDEYIEIISLLFIPP